MANSGNMREYIQVGVQAFIMKDNKLLMGMRQNAFAAGTYGVPGGRLEFGESLEQAAMREVMEETGLQISNPKFFGIDNNLFPQGNHHLQIGMLVSNVEGEPENVEPGKCDGWQYLDITSLPENICPATIGLLNQLLLLIYNGAT